MQAKVLLCCCIAALVGYGSEASGTIVPVTNAKVQQAAQSAVNDLNKNAPYAAKLTSVTSATKVAVAGSSNFNLTIAFNVTNSTCVPPVTDWAKCCQLGAPVACNASFICGQSCLLKTLKCGKSQSKMGCAGCIMPQTNLAELANITQTVVALYAQRNSNVKASTAKLISASTQVVAGIKYYLKMMLNIHKQVQICDFQVISQPWITTIPKLQSATCSACKKL